MRLKHGDRVLATIEAFVYDFKAGKAGSIYVSTEEGAVLRVKRSRVVIRPTRPRRGRA